MGKVGGQWSGWKVRKKERNRVGNGLLTKVRVDMRSADWRVLHAY